MKAIVTVFKTELKQREFAEIQLHSLCKEVKEVGQAVIFSPLDGKLVELLSVLRFHKIAYGTHFDTRDEKELVKV